MHKYLRPNTYRQMITRLLRVRFAQDILTLQAGRTVMYVFELIGSVIVARMLGREAFGVYTVAVSLRETFGFTYSLGQNQATRIFLSEAYGKRDRSAMQTVYRYFIFVATTAVGIQVILAVASPSIAMHLYQDTTIGRLAVLAFVANIASSYHAITMITLQTLRKVKLMTILQNIAIALQVLLIAIFLFMGFEAPGILIAIFLGNIIMQVVHLVVLYRVRQTEESLPGIRESVIHGGSIREFIKHGFWIALHKNLSGYLLPSTLLVMSFFTPRGTVGVAKIAFKMAQVPKNFLLQHASHMADAVLPTFTHKDKTTVRKHAAMLIKHTFVFHAMLSLGGMIVFPFLLPFLYGWEFVGAIIPMLWLLLVKLIHGITVINTTLFRMYRKTHIPVIWNAGALVIRILTLVILLQYIPPLTAFVLSILIHHVAELCLSWYLYQRMLRHGSLES